MTVAAGDFRWQAFFQRSRDALFVLNTACRILFVNTAWEQLVGLSRAEVRGRYCRRQRPPGAEIADGNARDRKILAHALTPPPEVLAGATVTTRRLLPGWPGERRWWEVAFLPFANPEGALLGILGRIRLLGSPSARPALNLPERLVALRETALRRPTLDWFGTSTPALRRLCGQVRLAATVPVPVLFVGAAGTGKQTLARIVHHLSPARERSFAALDCARLPPAVLADLLFGSPGLSAHGVDTVYLREPGRLPREHQARLAEALDGTAFPRVLAGCRDPGTMIESLAAALGALLVPVPCLRAQLGELPRRIETCLERLAEGDGKLVVAVNPEAFALLRDHPWPGNMRELFSVLGTSRARTTTDTIAAEHLPSAVRLPQTLARTPGPALPGSMPLDTLMEQTERRLIEVALDRARGNKTRAAELLGIVRERLVRRLKALNITDPETVPPGEIQIEPE